MALGLDAINEKLGQLKKAQGKMEAVALKVAMEHDYLIIDFNAEDQLYDRGVTAEDVPILNYMPYSPVTIDIKQEKGQPTDRVTLRDEGDFHESFKVEIENNAIKISAEDDKTGSLIWKYGSDIFGLNDENLSELRKFYVMPGMIEYLKKHL